MENINVGAFINNERPPSKAALKRALANDPAAVRFDATTAIGPRVGAEFTGDALPEGVRLVLVGPDPYQARNWYGNVELKNGAPRLT